MTISLHFQNLSSPGLPPAQGAGAAGVRPAGGRRCLGAEGCVRAAAPPWPVLHRGSAAAAGPVLGLQSAVTLHPPHPLTAQDTGRQVLITKCRPYST